MFPVNGYSPYMPMQPQMQSNAPWSFSPFVAQAKEPYPMGPKGMPNMPMMPMGMPNMPMGMPNMPMGMGIPNMPMGIGTPNIAYGNFSSVPLPNMNWQQMTWQPPKPQPMPKYDVYNMGMNQPYPMPNMGGANQIPPMSLGYLIGTTGNASVDKPSEYTSGPDLTGSGSIRGNTFKSGDGERWDVDVKCGKTYNLLSDNGVGINGRFNYLDRDKESGLVLDRVGIRFGDDTISMSNQGILLINGKEFKKGKVDLDGNITLKDGIYSLDADDYTVKLKALGSKQIRLDIEAEGVSQPEGIWGAAFNGEKETEKELRSRLKPNDYKVNDILTFDYEDNNLLGSDANTTLEDLLRNLELFNLGRTNRERSERDGLHVNGFFNMAQEFDEGRGAGNKLTVWDDMIGATSRDYRHDDIQWLQENMKTNKFYNLFSDEEIQVNVKVGENKLPEVSGFMVNGHEVKAELNSDKVMEVTVDGEKVEKGYSLDGISFTDVGKLRIESDGDEAYTLMTNVENKGLTFSIRSEHFGANKTRSTGIIGDVMGLGLNADLGDNDIDGSGYLRNPDGSITKLGQNMAKALKSYQVDNVFDTDTDNGWIVYQGD